MKQKSEQINLEYMVEFEDGLRPRVIVYGIDSKTGETYGAEAHVGVRVGAGYEVRKPIGEGCGILEFNREIFTSCVVNFLPREKFPETEDWEQKRYQDLREYGVNVIKIQSPEHIEHTINRHVELYKQQFNELAKRFANLFQGFIGEHPGYGKYRNSD